MADDTSRQIGTRDAFYGDLVPFLAALRENHSVPISFATVFGQKCTDPEPRGRAKEDRVRSALDDLVARLRAAALVRVPGRKPQTPPSAASVPFSSFDDIHGHVAVPRGV